MIVLVCIKDILIAHSFCCGIVVGAQAYGVRSGWKGVSTISIRDSNASWATGAVFEIELWWFLIWNMMPEYVLISQPEGRRRRKAASGCQRAISCIRSCGIVGNFVSTTRASGPLNFRPTCKVCWWIPFSQVALLKASADESLAVRSLTWMFTIVSFLCQLERRSREAKTEQLYSL